MAKEDEQRAEELKNRKQIPTELYGVCNSALFPLDIGLIRFETSSEMGAVTSSIKDIRIATVSDGSVKLLRCSAVYISISGHLHHRNVRFEVYARFGLMVDDESKQPHTPKRVGCRCRRISWYVRSDWMSHQWFKLNLHRETLTQGPIITLLRLHHLLPSAELVSFE